MSDNKRDVKAEDARTRKELIDAGVISPRHVKLDPFYQDWNGTTFTIIWEKANAED